MVLMLQVGCADGSIRLHAVSSEQPVAEWHNPAAVVSLQWSQTRATVFCMLDAASNLHVWDLSRRDTEAVITETLNSDRCCLANLKEKEMNSI